MSKLPIRTFVLACAAAIGAPSFADISDELRPKTRDEVKAELALARADGSLQRWFSETGYAPEMEVGRTRRDDYLAQRQALAQIEADRRMLEGTGEIWYEPTAAGPKTSAQVREELERARADGSLRRHASNRGYDERQFY